MSGGGRARSRSSIASLVSLGAMGFIVACASIAGLESSEPTPSETETNRNKSDGALTSDVASSTESGPASDARTGDGAGCTRQPNDQPCTKNEDCCSDSCHEDRKCHNDCNKPNAICDPRPEGDDCCIGTFCQPGLPPLCAKCRGAGEKAEQGMVKSCCSGAFSSGDTCK